VRLGVRTSVLFPVLSAALLAAPLVAQASDPFLTVLSEDEAAASPSQRYARMTRDEAVAELRARGAIFDEVPEEKAPGVIAPIRLTSRLAGLHVHGTEPEARAVTSPFEILDARLALTLHDFATVLARHDIDEVIHFTMYRPSPGNLLASRRSVPGPVLLPPPATPLAPSPRIGPAPSGDHRPRITASKTTESRRPPQLPPPGTAVIAPALPVAAPLPSEGQTTSRHPAGLAIDVGYFKKKSGATLSVAGQFQGRIGQKTCGAGVADPVSPEAKELRSIVCEAADLRLFTYVLTPNFNHAHRDHFHMEIKAGVKWTLVH
jgi:hypothetical protein